MKVFVQILLLTLFATLACSDGGEITLQQKHKHFPEISQKFQEFVRDESVEFLSFLKNSKKFNTVNGNFSTLGSFEIHDKKQKYYFDNSIGVYITEKEPDDNYFRSEYFAISGYKFLNANIALRIVAYYADFDFPQSGVNDDIYVLAQTYDLSTDESVDYYPDYFFNPSIFFHQKGGTFIIEFSHVPFIKALYSSNAIKEDVFFNEMIITAKIECSNFDYENNS